MVDGCWNCFWFTSWFFDVGLYFFQNELDFLTNEYENRAQNEIGYDMLSSNNIKFTKLSH